MNRRFVAAAVMAGALALTPMVAFAAYPAPSAALTCSQSTVPVSTVLTCTIAGPSGATATLTTSTTGENATIAGVASATKTIGISEIASFTVTAPSTALTIVITGFVGGVPTNGAIVGVTSGSGSLAGTGTNLDIAIGAGALLVLGGTALILGTRRWKKTSA